MNRLMLLTLTLCMGLGLGGLFFGGLWWTTQKALQSGRPANWILSSYFLRNGLALSSFFFVIRDSWQAFVVLLMGFMLSRWIVLKYLQNGASGQRTSKDILYES